MSERPEEAINWLREWGVGKDITGNRLTYAGGSLLYYITHLEAQVEADAVLWAGLKENGWGIAPDDFGSFDVYKWGDNEVVADIIACDPDPREAMRKAVEGRGARTTCEDFEHR